MEIVVLEMAHREENTFTVAFGLNGYNPDEFIRNHPQYEDVGLSAVQGEIHFDPAMMHLHNPVVNPDLEAVMPMFHLRQNRLNFALARWRPHLGWPKRLFTADAVLNSGRCLFRMTGLQANEVQLPDVIFQYIEGRR